MCSSDLTALDSVKAKALEEGQDDNDGARYLGAKDEQGLTLADWLRRYGQDPALKQRTEAWLQGHKPEVEAATAKIGAALVPCADDSAVQTAVEKLAPS